MLRYRVKWIVVAAASGMLIPLSLTAAEEIERERKRREQARPN